MYLIDTHILIWTISSSEKLSSLAKSKLSSGEKIYVSIASLWEIAIKQSIGKLDLNMTIKDISNKCDDYKISILPIDSKHLDYINKLPTIHSDPFDRLIVAQAITEGLTIITKDSIIPKYAVKVVW